MVKNIYLCLFVHLFMITIINTINNNRQADI